MKFESVPGLRRTLFLALTAGLVYALRPLQSGPPANETVRSEGAAGWLDLDGDGRVGRFEAAAAGLALVDRAARGAAEAAGDALAPLPHRPGGGSGAPFVLRAVAPGVLELAGDLGPDAPAALVERLLVDRDVREVRFGVLGDESWAPEVAAVLRATDVPTRLGPASAVAPKSPLLTASSRRFVDAGARVWADAERTGTRLAGDAITESATEASGLIVAVIGDGTASLRGLAAVDANVAWFTGSGPTVARTLDGGATLEDVTPPSIEGLDVRDVHALSGDVAWILTAGPGEASRILFTDDGGATWTEQHRETAPESFLDGFAFWSPTRAIAYGDPLPDVGFRILVTEDGGATWHALERGPAPLESGEASFAASGTGIVAHDVHDAWIVTGANDERARVFHTADSGATWDVRASTLPAAKPASGAFSIAFGAAGTGVVVGGDFTDRARGGVDVASWTDDGGASWHAPEVGPRGQRAGCAALGLPGVFVATGQTGTDITRDGGRTWGALSSEGFHCVAASKVDGTLWFAGPRGRVGRLR